MPMNSYSGQTLPSSSLCSGSALSTVGQTAYDLGPSGPPPDRLAPYVGQSEVTQRPPQGSQVMPVVTPGFEGKPNANHVRARISNSRTQRLHK
jgi:hypothetical protein